MCAQADRPKVCVRVHCNYFYCDYVHAPSSHDDYPLIFLIYVHMRGISLNFTYIYFHHVIHDIGLTRLKVHI